MKRRKVKWTWENTQAQRTFANWVGFPNVQQTLEELDKVETLLKIKPPLQVLDLGCGMGRHALEMAARGYRVVGTDVARSFLANARREAARRQLDVEFRLQRGSELQEKNAFDLVLAYNHTLGFMSDEELIEHFSRVRIALKPSGRLLLVLAGPKLFPNQNAKKTKDWLEKDGKFILSEKYIENGYRIEHDFVIDPDKEEITEFDECQRAFSFDGVLSLLRASGFKTIDALKDLDGNRATSVEFGVFICHKPATRGRTQRK